MFWRLRLVLVLVSLFVSFAGSAAAQEPAESSEESADAEPSLDEADSRTETSLHSAETEDDSDDSESEASSESEAQPQNTPPSTSATAALPQTPEETDDRSWISNHRESKPAEEIDVRKGKVEHVSLGGPRFGAYGVIVPDENARAAMKEVGLGTPVFMMLGWQFEFAWLAANSGFAGLFEIVPLVSGFEHGLFMPAVNLMAGIRGANGIGLAMGAQAGIGNSIQKNCKACAPQLVHRPFVAGVLAAGFVVPMGELLMPIDVVASIDQDSTRIGLLIGFADLF